MTLLHVAGTGLRGSGYPNASETLRILRQQLGWDIRDRARWLPEGTTLWRLAGGGRIRSALFLLKLLALNALECLRILGDRSARRSWTYVPYPAVFLLWWMSWLPRGWRPKLIADAYVSLWDAAFRDRGAGATGGIASAIARMFEARALRAANWILVDTVSNRDWFVDVFRIRQERIRAVPLAIGEVDEVEEPIEAPTAWKPSPTVLFVGTLVPLHGVGVVARAVKILTEREVPVRFEFVGDGQDRDALERLSAELPAERLHWERGWQSAAAVYGMMRDADVCLGVFGGAGKAERVLPFKIYLALASGRPIVTQRNYSLPEGLPPIPAVLVEPDGGDLANALEHLLEDQGRRRELADASRRYFDTNLGPRALAAVWRSLVDQPETEALPTQ